MSLEENLKKSIIGSSEIESKTKKLLKESHQITNFEKDSEKKYNLEQNQKEKELKEQHKFIQEIEDEVDKIDGYEDFNIEDIINGKELEKLLKETKPKKQQLKSKTDAPLKINGRRISREEKDSEVLQSVKDAGLKDKDYQKVVEKLKKTIQELETAANKIEADYHFNINEFPEKIESLTFLMSTNINQETVKISPTQTQDCKQRGLTRQGINQDLFINSYNVLKVDSTDVPKSIINTPEQLVFIHKLGKIFNTQFIQASDSNLKFTDIDRSILTYLSKRNTKPTVIGLNVLMNMLKKMIITSFSTTELAFRSTNIWIKPEFKSLIKSELIMMQGLPKRYRDSFNIFVTELLKTNDAQIFNRIEKLDYVIHSPCGIIEQTLARCIKTMTPMFIYDYFEAIKSIYLFAALLDEYYHLDKEKNYEDIYIISTVCLTLYQNTRLYQNSTVRTLPYLNESILSEKTQMYYLNHTMVGPQYHLLRCLSRACPWLVSLMN